MAAPYLIGSARLALYSDGSVTHSYEYYTEEGKHIDRAGVPLDAATAKGLAAAITANAPPPAEVHKEWNADKTVVVSAYRVKPGGHP